ncbi:MAG TPA: helix-turn-helix transcriptional regulator [Bacillota bacterium]|nr:helix-turn-helix transcriptional regulator [Bacillota bacterium]HOR86554.1 helix-turn-helix transcriptional regulator [Bacillota bacterium]HPL53602.1 helix-turn-helix transcriptional regulator [Bacillota bacterium]
MADKSVLTPQEVAEILKITKNTVYELIKRGELNAYKVGKKLRIDTDDLEAYKNRDSSSKGFLSHTKYKLTAPAKSTLSSGEEPSQSSGFVICGQDAILDILSRYLELHPSGTRTFRSYIGSYNGLYALYHGKVQVATAHLWDGDTGLYNVPYVRRMLPGIQAVIVHLACRLQGFYVISGNPKGINGWEDLKRNDITIINREKGSGTRVLLDEHLRKMNIPYKKIRGYENECASHLAIASTVARGDADFGMGNEKTSLQVKGIDFIPMQVERYELVMKKEDVNRPHFEAIIDILRSPEFRTELEGIGGYDLKEIGDIIAET